MSTRNLSLLYKDNSVIDQDVKTIDQHIEAFADKRKQAIQKKSLTISQYLQAIQEYENLFAHPAWTKPTAYRRLQYQTHLNDDEIKQHYNKMTQRERDISLQLQFFELALAKLPPKTQQDILASCPSSQHHFLSHLFAVAKYNLSADQEKVLTMMRKTAFNDRTQMMEEFLAKEQRNGKTFEQYMTLTKHEDTKIRTEAKDVIVNILADHADTATAEINAVLEYKASIDQLRGYDRPDQSRHLADDIDTEVVDAMRKAVRKSFDLAHERYQLKAKMMGQNTITYRERSANVGKIATTFDFPTGIRYIQKTFTDIDPVFADILQTFLDQGRIDVFPQQGKRGGAFNVNFAKNLPNFVMLNWTDDFDDITTFAHEMGHAIHSTFSCQHQSSLQFDYSMALAETASTFCEDFARSKVVADLPKQEQRIAYTQKLDATIATIFRQIACYEFEMDLHTTYRDTHYLSEKNINELFVKHMRAYMGDAVTFDQAHHGRVYRSHIRSFFYVYSYASGLLISFALQQKVKQNPDFIHVIKKEFLTQGSSRSPQEIFRAMDIDITDPSFWQQGIDHIREMIEEMKKYIAK